MIPQYNITVQSVTHEEIVDIIPEQEKSDREIQANEEKYFRQLQEVSEDKLRSDAKMYQGLADLSSTFGNILQKRQEKYRQDREAEIALKKAIELDPNNGILYYNLGVIYAEQGELELAKEKYTEAIALIPDYVDAYLNLVSVILEDEVKIVEEMNSLGNSSKDNLRYDELKLEREDLYKECVPLLEELIKVSHENIDALNTLKNIYGVLGNNEGFMQLKAKIEELQAN